MRGGIVIATLALFVGIVTSLPDELATLLDRGAWPANGYQPTDDIIKKQTLLSLKSLYTNSSSTSSLNYCDRCKASLEIGKAIALTKPDLIPEIFTQWCIDNKLDTASSCKTTYGRNTVVASRTGTDFTNLLQLIDPWSLDGDYLCYYKLGECPLPELPKVDLSSWWPAKNESNQATIELGNETFNVLHISDFHIELDYTLGAEANRSASGKMGCTPHTFNPYPKPDNLSHSDIKFFNSYYDEDGEFILGENVTDEYYNASVWNPAREFGAYTCDSPELLINSSLKSIIEYQKEKGIEFDFAIFTGDMVDHDELEYTDYQMTIESQELAIRDLKRYLKDIPVFPVLGNHDTFPYGQLASHKSGHENLYEWNDELMNELWVGNDWIPFEDSGEIKKHYTGYSVKTKKGLKVIAINSNTYYQKNYYSYWNMTSDFDQFGTLKFLVDELIESESKNEKVWIIAHIPFIDYDTLPIQAEIYRQIVTRFSPTTIVGLFFGHTHQDQFNVLYANDNKTVDDALLNVWISQSVTPLSFYNPGWRYYEVDSKSFNVMNSFNFYTKLNNTFDNLGSEPTWEFEYSARDVYDPNGNWPKSAPLNGTFWAKVAQSFQNDTKLKQLYSDYSYRLSPYVPICSEGECEDFDCYVGSFNINEFNACIEKTLS